MGHDQFLNTMPLVFAAITAHPPILLPSTPAEARERLAATKAAMEKLETELYVTRPNLIVIISPHTSFFAEAFSVNAHTHFSSNFEEFGDVQTKHDWIGAPDFAARLAHGSEHKSSEVRLISQEQIDHGASIPLLFLTRHLPHTKILPIGFSNLQPKDHLDFGERLKETILHTDKRVAVIASGDLSHTLSPEAPGGFNPLGKKFDQTIQELLFARNTMGLTNLDPDLVKAADECGYRSILVLLGVLKNIDFSFETLAYESPFGIGYLTGIFHF